MEQNPRTFLTIIVPCYNEEESLPGLKASLENFKARYEHTMELVFVDDGSSDKTHQVLQDLFQGWPGLKILRHSHNAGLGGAVKTALQAASGDYTAVIDSDGSYSIDYLHAMTKYLLQGYDVVDGSAHHPEAGFSQNTPGYRVFLSRSVVYLYNLILGESQYCYTSMFRIYRTSELRELHLRSNGFLLMTEIKVKLLLKHKKFFEFPARSQFRKFGVSKMRLFRNIKDHLVFMLKTMLFRVTKMEGLL